MLSLKDLKKGNCYLICTTIGGTIYYIKYLSCNVHPHAINVWYSRLFTTDGEQFNKKAGFLTIFYNYDYKGNFYPIRKKFFYKMIRKYNESGRFKEGEIL